MILTSITSRRAVIKGQLIFYIMVDLEDSNGNQSRVVMDIEKGADEFEVYNKLHSLTQRVKDA
jgi:hypothetical protein